MTIKSFTFNPFMTNCYVCHSDGEAVLVDASSYQESEHREIIRYIEEAGLTMKHLLLTHGHIDHIFGCAYMVQHFGMPFQMHHSDSFLIERSMEQATAFGVPMQEPPEVSTSLEEGSEVAFGKTSLSVLHTPGHSPGSVTFVSATDGVALSGDVLFRGSVGRTEGLPETSQSQLFASIQERLLPLGDDMRVLPGHGPETTIGQERKSNPFLQELSR